MLPIQDLNQNTSETRISEVVDAIRKWPELRNTLVELLPERISVYRGRSTNEVVRIRGYILAAFEQVGLPTAALPFVLDELENGRHAYLVAAAAKALRGLEGRTADVVPFLWKAVENIKYVDDAVTFEQYKPQWPVTNYTTALQEIFKTFAWLGTVAQSALPALEALYASGDVSAPVRAEIQQAIKHIQSDRKNGCCCCHAPMTLNGLEAPVLDKRESIEPPLSVEFEDQEGRTRKYRDFFSQTPAIVVFFYTRCNNPNKCSLTITKLARLQNAIREAGLQMWLKTAAITYDPEYDLPVRLKSYGLNRGILFSENDLFFRTRTGFEELQKFFELGVNFNDAIVNQHRIELFILNDRGQIVTTFSRLQWDVEAVLERARALLMVNVHVND